MSTSMSAGRYLAAVGGAAASLALLTSLGAWALWRKDHEQVIWLMMAAALPFAGAVFLTLRQESAQDAATARRALIVILATAAATRGLLVFAPPVSTDIYRYVWDGRVQGAGINPYRYRPADPELGPLRDAAIFPNINRAATAVTIYPPMAQMVFFAATRLAESVTMMKVVMVAFEACGVAALLALLRHRDLPPTRILLYAWHPLPLFEFAGSGHVDAVAIAFMLLGCLAAERRRPGLAGALLAAGTLAKFFPLAIAPALYRRWDWRAPLIGIAVLAALYLPYLAVGWQVFGYLPGYAQEENLTSGGGFFLLGALSRIVSLPSSATAAYLGLGLLALGGVGLAALMRPRPDQMSLKAALILITLFTLILSPHLAWYFTWIVPFLCVMPSWSLTYMTVAAPILYGLVGPADDVARGALIYLPFVAILGIEWVIRMRHRPSEPVSHVRHIER